MKKVKSFQQVLRFSMIGCSMLIASFAIGSAPAAAEEPMRESEWFQQKCEPQIQRYQADRMVIRDMVLIDAWTSPMTDQLPWPTAFRSRFAKHACVSVSINYMNQAEPQEERFLCSVLDNDQPTEVKIFGNADLAAEICAEPG